MATTEEAIKRALLERVETLALGIDTVWPNKSYAPAAQKYLRVQFVPNITERPFMGSADSHQFMGILLLSVFWPLNAGTNDLDALVGKVVEHFPADLNLYSDGVRVMVTKRPTVRPMLTESTCVHVPIEVSYQSFH